MRSSLFYLIYAVFFSALLALPIIQQSPAQAQSLMKQRAASNEQATRTAPSAWRTTAAYINFQQQKFYRALAKSIRKLREERSIAAAYSLILLSFLYGIFHAAGPGHGKMVISAYLLANERVVRKGILLAFLSALMQAITAIILVGTAIWLIAATGRKTQGFVGTLEQASYALICIVGLYMIWQAIFGHNHATDHDHNHKDHDHSHDHAHIPTADQVLKAKSWKQAASIIFAVGIRPCSGAVLVMIFANTLGLIAAGILATFAMALGTAITVATLAVLTLFSKNIALKLFGETSIWANRAFKVLSVSGACAIFLIGAVLLWGSLTAPARPFI